MRKPLIALGLVASTGMGAIPVAATMAAAPPTHTEAGKKTQYSGTTTTPTYTGTQTSTRATSNAVSGASIVQTAMKYLGYPYTATGNSPSTGFSCIGFVSFVYRSNGIALPGDLADALAYAPSVPFSQLQPGDILYFQNTVWNGLSHAAIYIGGGRFIHAEWYNYGVTISSFNGDKRDGNYWISKYLGANRPWGGASVGAVAVAPSGPTTSSSTSPGATSVTAGTQALTGPTAYVTVASLNVRSGPSKSSAVQQVVGRGMSLTVVGHRGAWYKVQLPDGTIGWVVAQGIGKVAKASSSTGTTSSLVSGGPNATVGNVVTPARLQAPAKRRQVASVRVTTLRVRTAPSTYSTVVSSAARGQSLQVLGRSGGWVHVRLPDGSTGWVSAAYLAGKSKALTTRPTTASSAVRSSTRTFGGGTLARVAVRVHYGPSMSAGVVTVMQPGTSYRVLGSSNGWTRVQLANGTVGWVSTGVIGGSPSTRVVGRSQVTRRAALTRVRSTASGGSTVTASVRVHARPGLKSTVVTVAAAGTRVQVLSYSGGWALVRLPNGTTGYVSAAYVH